MYQLFFHPRTEKFLQKIPRQERQKLLRKINILSHNPFNNALDLKKLAGTQQSYRLRVGTIRVIYEVNQETRKIYLQEIGFRGSIY